MTARWTATCAPLPVLCGALLFAGSSRVSALAQGGHRTGGLIDAADRSRMAIAFRADAQCTGEAPGARAGHALAYDRHEARTLMFGGASPDVANALPSSLWAWDGRRWQCLAPDGPPGRTDAELAYDPARRRLVLYGGRRRLQGQQRVLTDTWEWDGARWSLRDSAGPGARVHMVMAYDSALRGIVLHGGGSEKSALHDTWLWDGKAWKPLTVRADSSAIPNAMVTAASESALLVSAFPNSATDRTGLFRAGLSELRDARWAAVAGLGPAFSPLAPAARTARGLMLYAGWPPDGDAAAWLFADGKWTATARPPPRRRSARLVYDERRGRVVLFGGEDSSGLLADIWEWEGRRWEQVTPRARDH
ncbi:MAG TPA: hypothetical protein VHE78_17235 [Gemmatimonadaceae bacterium]|nr:hypothetical protein [Gemmatimonadaceae bacterium]